MPTSSQKATASTPREPDRHAKPPLQCNFHREPNFGAAVIRLPSGSYTRLASRLHPPRSLCRTPGGQAVYTTHRPVGCLPRDVVSLRVRHGQLTRLDSHQLDCGLVGCSSRVRLAAAACPRRIFPNLPKLKRSPVCAPWMPGYTSSSTPLEVLTVSLALSPDGVSLMAPATYREPLCLRRALPASGWCPAPPRRALPLLPCSYELMRPTTILSLP